jgi:hypothetical protein
MANRTAKSISKLKREADKYFSQATRLRHADAKGYVVCITCQKVMPWKQAQAGHFVSRKVNVLRFDPENVNPQCYACNVMKYGERYEYAKQIDLMYGEGKADELHNRRFETHKFTTDELLEIIHDAKEEIKYYSLSIDTEA